MKVFKLFKSLQRSMRIAKYNNTMVEIAESRSRELVRKATIPEKIVYNALLKSKYAPYLDFQVPVYITWKDSGKIKKFYIADFLIDKINVVIEVDGGYHKEVEQRKKDRQRDRELKELDLITVRITNQEVYSDPSCKFLLKRLERFKL